mgnify:CR=1 FL=1
MRTNAMVVEMARSPVPLSWLSKASRAGTCNGSTLAWRAGTLDVEAARLVRQRHPSARFALLGFLDQTRNVLTGVEAALQRALDVGHRVGAVGPRLDDTRLRPREAERDAHRRSRPATQHEGEAGEAHREEGELRAGELLVQEDRRRVRGEHHRQAGALPGRNPRCTPQFAHIAPGDALTEKNVRAVYPDAIIQAYRVEAKQSERKSQLIDISELFKGDLLGVSAPFAPPPIPGLMGGPQGGAMGLDRDKTFMLSLKGLPENIVAITQYHFVRGQNRPVVGQSLVDSRSASYKVMYNLSALPVGNGYKPRFADPRVGAGDAGGRPRAG